MDHRLLRQHLAGVLYGPFATNNTGTISCNRVFVTESGNGNMLKHLFTSEDKCKETGIREILTRIYM